MLVIDAAVRSVRQERKRCAEGLPHQVINGLPEPESLAAFLVSKDYGRRPRLLDLKGKHENRRTVSVVPPNESRCELRGVERPLYRQHRDSNAIAENAGAESCEQTLHGTGL